MKLSVVIVNYNVRHFLEQSLNSVLKAAKNISAEIFVVDNNSVDGSVEMMKKKFPQVILIENKENKGFSTANNQAIKQAKSEYILLLNPDTVVEEDTFEKTMNFMDAHPEAGALGVKMLDGKGNFLPESKRGFPTPEVAFYKLFGLAKIFPKSKIFGKYHLGYLDENKINEVDVMAGAFMLIRKKVLDEIGLLDEHFFMYGEDIDLSYRIKKAGWKNYYFPETRIIHYKGESTKKGSLDYVKMFYGAMLVFSKKHFSQQQANTFSLLIRSAIFFKAGMSVFSKYIGKMAVPLTDVSVIYAGMFLIKNFWEENVKKEISAYPEQYMTVNVPVYILLWLVSVYYSGGYDKPFRLSKVVRGIFVGTILIAAIYGFIPESYRFSRGMILLGTAWAISSMIFLRWIKHFIRYKNFGIEENLNKKLAIVGNYEEGKRALSLLNEAKVNLNFIGFVTPKNILEKQENFLGTVEQLNEIAEVYKIDEIIFCSKDISSQEIIEWMAKIPGNIDYKILPTESLSIIGSNSKDTAGDYYSIDITLAITTDASKRNKRLLDVLLAVGLLLFSPILIFVVKQPAGFLKNIFSVLFGKKTWVGYSGKDIHLPKIKEGIFSPLDSFSNKITDENTINRLNFLYAKDYSAINDLEIIWKGMRNLGR